MKYIYCVSRADEILTSGGITGIYGSKGYGAIRATDLINQIEMQNELGKTGVLQNILDDMVDMIADPDSMLHNTD